jgi:transcriptional pleiotropic regulator of transition state genes
VRQVDEMGRVVIPMEVRRQLGIEAGDGVEFLVNGGDIVLQKYRPGCVFCGNVNGLERYRGKWVCGECCRLLMTEAVGRKSLSWSRTPS